MDKRCAGCEIKCYTHNCILCSFNPAFQLKQYIINQAVYVFGNDLYNVNPHRKKWKGESKLTREALKQMVATGVIQ